MTKFSAVFGHFFEDCPFLIRHFLSRFVITFFLLWGVTTSLHAGNLVSIQTGTLTSLPGIAPITMLLTLDDRPVALTADATWLLDTDQNAWTRIDWRPAGQVRRVTGDKHQVFLLLDAGPGQPLEKIEKVTLLAGKPVSLMLPALPLPLTAAYAAMLDGRLYVVGNDAKGILKLRSINPAEAASGWATHDDPGNAVEISSMAGQKSALYVTFNGESGKGDRLLQWTATDRWIEKTGLPGGVVAGSARPSGQAHVLYLVRPDNGADSAPSLMMFHTITGSWAALGDPKAGGARISTAWRNGILWERHSTSGGSEFAFAEIEATKILLKWLDWVVIVVYLVGMTGIGLYFYLREKRISTADFFVGGRSIPFWAAGVSLYATNTSSISYIAIPAKAFETNWQYLMNNLVAVVGLVFVAIWIVPLLRRLDLMSVFQYLETRFHPVIRMLASGLCIAMQLGSRMSVVLFLPSLAISTITGIDVVWSIWIMGAVTIAYTAMGGMKAVIWTDFVQLFVMFGGAIFAIGFIVYKLDGGISEFFAIAAAEDKMKLFDWSFDLTKATVWGFIFLVLFDVVFTFPKDQVLMQRVLSTKSDKDAGKSVWMFAAIMIPGGFMFYIIGTALYVFYKSHPERMNPLLGIDATFPLFIAAELPIGVTGLVIAAIFAASMSTLSSIMNSVATLASVDFYERFVKEPTPKGSVFFAEAMTILAGLIGIGLALLLSRYDIRSMFDVSIELAGLLGGGFAGAYTLGMFTRRANWQGVAIGIASAIVLTTLMWSISLVHSYFYLAISILTCIVVGYLASLFFPAPSQSLVGLTILNEAAKP